MMDVWNALTDEQAAEVAGGANSHSKKDMGAQWWVGNRFLMYRVAKNDNLESIAASFRSQLGMQFITAEYLQRINNRYFGNSRIPNAAAVYAGDELLIYDKRGVYC